MTLMELHRVVRAARRIGADPDGYESCGMMAPCAAEDDFCRCTRLAKLALDCHDNVTAAFDRLPAETVRSAPILAKWRGQDIMALEGWCHRNDWRIKMVSAWLEPTNS
jgi:hypothetical protein